MTRKPKNKHQSIDQQIEAFLEDDEYIIWSQKTQSHFADFSKLTTMRLLRGLIGLYMIFLGISFLFDAQLFGAFAGSILCLPFILFLIRDSVASYIVFLGISLMLTAPIFGVFTVFLVCLSIASFVAVYKYTYDNVKHHLNSINVVTNYNVMVYNPVGQDIVYAFEHDAIHRFMVREYGDNIGNITVDRRSDQKAKYRVTPKYPVQFVLRGIDDLSTVVGLLRSQLGIEPEYLQIHAKPKR